MSLDVYLLGKPVETECTCWNCGHTHTTTEREYIVSLNITHNLGKMAAAAGLYVHLWRPEELGITQAGQLVDTLKAGLEDLRSRPEFFKVYNSPNGWGTYEGFIEFVSQYLAACVENPEAEIKVSR